MTLDVAGVSLSCPRCRRGVPTAAEEGWCCSFCGATFPFERGVARFIDSEKYTVSFGFQWKKFATTQLDSVSKSSRSRDAFVEKTGWDLADLRGRTVLDAGCGMGRFAEACADAGAEVWGVDLSEAVEAAAGNLGSRPNVHLLQADIMALPFADSSFDFVYSIGVLHHTPDTRAAFLQLTRLVKPGGRISIWVYSSTGLRALIGSELLRPLTSRMPKSTLLQLCRIAVPLYHVHRIPLLGRITQRLLPTSMERLPDWRWLDTFDWYSPRYQWKHSFEEVEGWFREAGLTDVQRLSFPVSVSGTRARPDLPEGS